MDPEVKYEEHIINEVNNFDSEHSIENNNVIQMVQYTNINYNSRGMPSPSFFGFS